MPNHVYMRMSINGKQDDIDNFYAHHLSKKDDEFFFDFNTFIPMPEELRGTKAPVNEPESDINKRLREVYGADNWYDWSIQNWGTKWNSYGNQINISDNIILFQTAWSEPAPIFRMMAAMYPSLSFNLDVVEEGGFFAGVIKIKNGKVHEDLSNDSQRWRKYAKKYMGFTFDEDD